MGWIRPLTLLAVLIVFGGCRGLAGYASASPSDGGSDQEGRRDARADAAADGPTRDVPAQDGFRADGPALEGSADDGVARDGKGLTDTLSPDVVAALDGQPDAAQPDAALPDAALPDIAPDAPLPDAALPDSAPDAPATGSDGGVPGSWIAVGPGQFTMGSPSSEPCRVVANETQHLVTLTKGFELQSTEVTQAQFLGLMGYNPAQRKPCGAACPVETVSWHEAVAYCNALSTKKGYASCYLCTGSGAAVTCAANATYAGNIYACPGYRLPTEAEWEYAYRASTTSALYNGANSGGSACTDCGKGGIGDPNASTIAWYCMNSNHNPHPAAGKQPNGWGLYDMAGNVWEWCHDWYGGNITSAQVDPAGPATGSARVLRGGAWSFNAHTLRAAQRYRQSPTGRYNFAGFRCARTK